MNTAVGLVPLVQEVDDHNIVFLPVAVATTNALLDPLRVPGEVVIHHQRAELQVDPLRRRLGGDHDGGMIPKMLDEGRAAIDRPGTGDAPGAGIRLDPAVDDLPGLRVGVGAVEEDDLAAVAVGFEEVSQVVLRAAGLGEHKRLAFGPHLRHLCQADFEGLVQRPAFRVDADTQRPLGVAGEFVDLRFEEFAAGLLVGWRVGFVVALGVAEDFIQEVPSISSPSIRSSAGWSGTGSPSRSWPRRAFIVSSVLATARDDEASSFRRIKVVRCRCRLGKAKVFSRIR